MSSFRVRWRGEDIYSGGRDRVHLHRIVDTPGEELIDFGCI